MNSASPAKGLTVGSVAAALFVIMVWGVTFVNTKALLADFSALEIQVLRYAIGWAALKAIGALRRKESVRTTPHDELMFAMMGLSGVAVYQLLENCAIHYTNASNVSILVCMCPLLTALVARTVARWRCRGERVPAIPWWFFLGFAVAITGVVLVSMNGISEFHFNPLGDLLAALAMLSWAVYSNLATLVNEKGYAPTFVIRRTFFWALVFMVPPVIFGLTPSGAAAMKGSFAIVTDAAVNARRFSSAMNYVNLGFLGLFASALCFVLWNRALAAIGTVRCTIGLYLLPVVTVVFAYLFLGEALTPASALGAALILAGVILSGWRRT